MDNDRDNLRPLAPWQKRLHEVIFEADTPAGKLFDVLLLAAILLSVIAVMLESVPRIDETHGTVLQVVEWVLTVLFTIEYVLRLACVRIPTKYVFSFYGIIDLLAILPAYLSVLMPGAESLLVVRALRLLRVFRVLKLARYVDEAKYLVSALRSSARKILVFVFAILTLDLIIGAIMYLIEGHVSGTTFTSIPRSMYWAIVTMTTVGYGDISPVTPLGQALAAVLMILGYGIIAVPTGIVSVEMIKGNTKVDTVSTQACPDCSREGHDIDAEYCKFCGASVDL